METSPGPVGRADRWDMVLHRSRKELLWQIRSSKITQLVRNDDEDLRDAKMQSRAPSSLIERVRQEFPCSVRGGSDLRGNDGCILKAAVSGAFRSPR